MKQSPCDQLDDYMLGWLSPDEAAEFERHLTDCPACRRQQALQQSIDGLLAGSGGSLDAIPSGLVERTRHQVKTARRRKALQRTFGLVAAATVLIAAVIGRFTIWSPNRPGDRDVAVSQNAAAAQGNTSSNSPLSATENPKESTRVALADPSSGIVLECKTRDPRINIVWIYPTVHPDATSGGQSDE
ncbi:MAG: zf-HC2 domain-containing protein [Thermoguttaceae bacterium]|jgi:anti-sigma factor RsiW